MSAASACLPRPQPRVVIVRLRDEAFEENSPAEVLLKLAPPPKNPDRWYERGYGPRWRRKRGGGIGGRKTSQFLNRSWAVEPRGVNEVLLTNRATYTKWVHLNQYQTNVHQRTGWVTDTQGVQRAEASGDIVRVIDRALANILPVKE